MDAPRSILISPNFMYSFGSEFTLFGSHVCCLGKAELQSNQHCNDSQKSSAPIIFTWCIYRINSRFIIHATDQIHPIFIWLGKGSWTNKGWSHLVYFKSSRKQLSGVHTYIVMVFQGISSCTRRTSINWQKKSQNLRQTKDNQNTTNKNSVFRKSKQVC